MFDLGSDTQVFMAVFLWQEFFADFRFVDRSFDDWLAILWPRF